MSDISKPKRARYFEDESSDDTSEDESVNADDEGEKNSQVSETEEDDNEEAEYESEDGSDLGAALEKLEGCIQDMCKNDKRLTNFIMAAFDVHDEVIKKYAKLAEFTHSLMEEKNGLVSNAAGTRW